MFNFFKKNKKIDAQNVKNFDSAIKVIKKYIDLDNWTTASLAIEEITQKESDSFNKFASSLKIENQKEKEKIIEQEKKKFEKRMKKIENVKLLYEKQKAKYTNKLEGELFKIRFTKIKAEVDKLLSRKEALEAMSLLKSFVEENKEKTIVLKFYNTQKKKVQAVIDKQRKQEQERIKQNTQYEAMCLIGDINRTEEIVEAVEGGFLNKMKEKLRSIKTIREGKENKKLLQEIKLLLEEGDNVKKEIAERKLEGMHRGLVKEISNNTMIGYDLYGKILGANKISGDAFGIEETKTSYKFFIGDATGHGIKAGFIITMLNKLFNINYEKELTDLVFDINNQLKQKLETRNFVTGIFFEIDKISYEVSYVGLGHEPMLVYRKKTKTVERIIPGGLAMGIVAMKDKNLIKVKNLNLSDGDILMTYSDGLVELKNIDGEFYGIKRVEEALNFIASNEKDIHKMYDYLINDAKLYRGGSKFDDDLTIVLLKRDKDNDIVVAGDNFLEKLRLKEGVSTSELRNVTGKTRKQVTKEMEEIKRKKEVKMIISNLENLYYTGEMLKLKEEATRYIKEGFIDKKINYYLRKAIENEAKYKINLKNQKMQAKYNVLTELFKKGDFNTVIKEVEDIVSHDGNI